MKKLGKIITTTMLMFSAISLFLYGNTNRIDMSASIAENTDIAQNNQTNQSTDKDSTQRKTVKPYTTDTYNSLTTVYPMDTRMPENVRSVVEYDVKSGYYIFRTYVGDMEISTPFMMTADEYLKFSAKRDLNNYWRTKDSATSRDNEDKFSITDMKFDIGPADKIFGPGGVQLKTQGSAELIFGVKHNKIDNPAYTPQMRNNITPEFDMKIQMNMNGTVGDKVNFGLNYNTESTFDFDQKMVKLAFQGKEDDILQNIEAGNVSMTLNSGLITGSQALFGMKADLKFGKLKINTLISQQNSESRTVRARGGAQTTDFEIGIDEYEENRHFFLSHFFKDKFETSMSTLPIVSSGVTITRLEVWITNKRSNYEQSRNIVAFMDLGEGKSNNIGNQLWNPAIQVEYSANKVNSLYETILNVQGARDIQQANSVLSGENLVGGDDFEKIESARRLEESEYSFNPLLGYISLRQMLQPDEVLAVAFEYSYKGNVYQVGEFSTGTIDAPNALFVKLLKSTNQSPQLKMWELMMKNIYSLSSSQYANSQSAYSGYSNSTQLQQEDFKLNIVYRNDSVGTEMQYLTEGDIKNQLLLRVMRLDSLDARQNHNPDGRFDYVEGLTVQSNNGRIIFPVREPFGKYLRKKIGNDNIADNYVFEELYDSTLVIAREMTEKNKFRIKGEYKGTSGAEINLNAWNIPRGSVTVTAGGTKLTENVDYTVDYMSGIVRITNPSISASNNNIEVRLENQSTFNMQRKSLLGTHLEYEFSKNFTLGGTLMHLSEMPLTTKVNSGSEPIANTIWGLNTAWRGESQWLTNAIDKLPFVNATAPSTFAINAEFAQLVPGHPKVIGQQGLAYIDDFESTKTSYDIHYPVNWYLASTPSMFPEATLNNNIEYGKNRALLSWYSVDQVLNSQNPGRGTPVNLRNNAESQSNHLTRDVLIREVFPNKSYLLTDRAILTVMNLSYYPQERGPYNLDADGIDATGNLLNPRTRWGGIMRKLENTDFETSNIEYIEFWMMDPFIYDTDGTDRGGDLYFNLGDISEDILKDGKKSFENGLPVNGDSTLVTTTVWGKVPKTQSTVTAFDNAPGARAKQDVGLNGLSTEEEKTFPAYANYLEQVQQKVNAATWAAWQNDRFSPRNDPSGDNYEFYKSINYDASEADILTRYKHFNGTEGNSPDAQDVDESYSTTATSLPDVEDINNDNTLNEYEKYYIYKVAIRRDSMRVGTNHITDSYTSNVRLANGNNEAVTWYQFKIPIREADDKEGNIRNFKSIRFIRMFMTDFEREKTLRFAALELVRGEWRSYSQNLYPPDHLPITTAKLDVQAVNIEENSDKSPVNYVLPPGVTRQTDPGQTQILQLNEQSMVLRVTDLSPGDAKAVYKNTNFDMRNYKRLQMFVHAEQLSDDITNLKDGELTCFIRLGSDLKNNYYEYEIPLRLTPAGVYSGNSDADRAAVWYQDNMFDFPFSVLTEAKLKRNKQKQDGSFVSDQIPFYHNEKNKIRIIGNPSIANVECIMIGIRNASTKGEVKSGEIWVNELRMSQFDEDGGWAAMGNMALALSDIANINFAGRIETAGFGGIESSVLDRNMDDMYQVNFSANVNLGRFLPEKAQIQLPAYFSYTNETLTPKYNPLDQDILLTEALNTAARNEARDTIRKTSQTVNITKSFNIAGAKINIHSKKPMFYDPANLSFTYSFAEREEMTPEVESNMDKQQRAAISYSYSFNPKAVEPFKKVKLFQKPAFKIISDFNFNYLPTSLSFNSDMNRNFTQLKLRDLTGSASNNFDLSFSRDFMWLQNFNIQYDLTKEISLSLQTAMNANIEEGRLAPELDISKDEYANWRDTVWQSIRRLGNPYTYQQVFNAAWRIPINKIPFLEWISTSNVSYQSTYSWNRTAQMGNTQTEIGNIASTLGATSGDVSFNFETLYNKSKYLSDVNKRFASNQSQQRKFQPRTFRQTINIKNGDTVKIAHRLNAEKLDFIANDKKGKSVAVKYKRIDNNNLQIFPKADVDSVEFMITTLDPNNRTVAQNIADFSARTLMMVRRASITYRSTNAMVLPGFYPEPGFFGQQKDDNGLFAPGIGFVFGLFDDNTIPSAKRNGWLNTTDTLSATPATTAFTEDIDVKLTLEPLPGFKIDLSAKRYTATNTSMQFMFNNLSTYTGSYNITQIAIGTIFKKIETADNNYRSQTFERFLQNRQTVADRLERHHSNTNYPNSGFLDRQQGGLGDQPFDKANGTYQLNSADVLIPAFLAAYTGVDADNVNTNPFLPILSMLPNWRISYDGLSKLPLIRDAFKSVSLTHAYTCRYSIGNYTSYSSWVAFDQKNKIGYVPDENGLPIPSSPYDITTVSLNEQFAPLIGVNVALKNSMTAKAEYRKQRNLSLNLSSTQLVEMTADEFVIGMGYIIKDFDLILRLKNKSQTKIKNDLKLTADVSYKDLKTLLRKIDENITQPSTGNKLISVKVTADYVFSSKVNIQMFFDHQSTTPLVSTSFPVSATNFGVSFKFMLTR
ncbi:MAG: cell surface protein SprA [Paludibacter sp.]|jgi:cell surface protein SprA|nr:cell surface protein SprA [Paludibacter sp.]